MGDGWCEVVDVEVEVYYWLVVRSSVWDLMEVANGGDGGVLLLLVVVSVILLIVNN